MIYYIRDEEGSLIGIKYNNEIYYYIKNLQEDIIGITDNNYNLLCRYEYDSRGRIITIKDNNGNIIEEASHIGIINPYRYRSYYYDKETKLYYLNSRYYNPEWGRFINADNYISNGHGLLGYNMYLYCNNNPIVNNDLSGHFFESLINCIRRVSNNILDLTAKIINNDSKQKAKAMKEIEAVQKKYDDGRICPKPSQEFQKILNSNALAAELETYRMPFHTKINDFVSKVNDGKVYDLKRIPEWKNKVVYFDGLYMEPQDIGNYHYGYIGRAYGFPTEMLIAGAGANQLKNHKLNTINNCLTGSFCDDPRDTYFIMKGAMAYDRLR